MDEKEILKAHVPQPVQDLIAAGRMDKVAGAVYGIKDFSVAKIAEHIGTKLAERRQRWRTVNDGLSALNNLAGR